MRQEELKDELMSENIRLRHFSQKARGEAGEIGNIKEKRRRLTIKTPISGQQKSQEEGSVKPEWNKYLEKQCRYMSQKERKTHRSF